MMMDVDSDTGSRKFRACVTCKQYTIRDYMRYKNCTTCREKNRFKQRLAAQRKQQRNQLWAMEMLNGAKSDISDSDDEDDGSTGEENHETRPDGAPPAKKRKMKLISELDGKEKEVALLDMKNGLKRKLRKKVVVAPPTKSSGKEYQTASVLYDTLKRKVQASSASEFLQFYGYHTIVANQDINNRTRTKMVVDDMRKIVRVPFDLTGVQKSQNATTKSYALTYPCACLGYDTPAAAAPIAPGNASSKGTKGDLIRQARVQLALSGGSGSATGASAPARVRRECGGRVYVLTKDDNSHPLGILGQRISVRVQHP
ncbi:hypothetical protein M413DRAFT_448447 [Hebeloma cylindrosporum]|uniref:Uncharacterized protein n=1 Tax=Hebeloma cylindrosporum TaxID=76867 RepID=A0A0C3BZB6_HEBCY|nr:hypothetical protein M413DRAFT_448447 [Hebeloma cylindrosporum h7]